MNFLFWGWFKALLQYSFYPVIANAFAYVYGQIWLNFFEQNGTMMSNSHTPLIAHTADDILTTLTGLYGDRHGMPVSNSYQAYNADGTTGSFGADVTNTLDEFGDSTETVLVTSGSDPDAPIGSVFETVIFGDTGIESLYTDIPSTTGGAIEG